MGRIFLVYFALNKKKGEISNFLTKPMDYPLWKNSTFWKFSTCCFYCLKRPFPPSTISWNVFFWAVLRRIERWKCFKFLTENIDYPLRKNPNFSSFLTFCFYSPKRFSSFLKCRETHIPGLFSHKYKDGKISNF